MTVRQEIVNDDFTAATIEEKLHHVFARWIVDGNFVLLRIYYGSYQLLFPPKLVHKL